MVLMRLVKWFNRQTGLFMGLHVYPWIRNSREQMRSDGLAHSYLLMVEKRLEEQLESNEYVESLV